MVVIGAHTYYPGTNQSCWVTVTNGQTIDVYATEGYTNLSKPESIVFPQQPPRQYEVLSWKFKGPTIVFTTTNLHDGWHLAATNALEWSVSTSAAEKKFLTFKTKL